MLIEEEEKDNIDVSSTSTYLTPKKGQLPPCESAVCALHAECVGRDEGCAPAAVPIWLGQGHGQCPEALRRAHEDRVQQAAAQVQTQ